MQPVPTTAIIGLQAHLIQVEADSSFSQPAFNIVGLPDAAVQEARERVRSALRHSGYVLHRPKLTVNLAPADLRKIGAGYDLPIAIALLTDAGEIKPPKTGWPVMVGELALDGSIRPIHGALSSAITASTHPTKTLIVPVENAREAALVRDVTILPASHLTDVIQHFRNENVITPQPVTEILTSSANPSSIDLSAIRGQEQAKRALEIAAAGAHNILLSGTPGSGKTMLARAFPGILPPLNRDEALEITRLHSVAGILARDGFCTTRPFRAPHHTASGAAIVGGGTIPKPGEISLAHRGVLFLDEFAEFPRHVLENLRQPLEDGVVNVSRAQGSVTYPARITLVAAMNPCPCGYYGDTDRACTCTPIQINRYSKRLSGPLLDRIDLCVMVPRVSPEKLTDLSPGEDSNTVRTRIEQARNRQLSRKDKTNVTTNAELTSEHIRKHFTLTDSARSLLRAAAERLSLSARSYFRVMRVAATIADLAASDLIDQPHIAEALQYRQITSDH